MKTIELIKGEIQIPEQYVLSEKKKRLTIRTPWSVKVSRLDKDNFHISTQMWFRSKKMKEKPFIPEGFIEFDGVRYKVIDVKPRTQATLTELSLNNNFTVQAEPSPKVFRIKGLDDDHPAQKDFNNYMLKHEGEKPS